MAFGGGGGVSIQLNANISLPGHATKDEREQVEWGGWDGSGVNGMGVWRGSRGNRVERNALRCINLDRIVS